MMNDVFKTDDNFIRGIVEMKTYLCHELIDVRDGTHDSPKYIDTGYPLITSKNLVNGSIDFSNVNYIAEADYLQINKRSKVDQGDILYSMIGSIGNFATVDVEPNFAIKNVALFKFNNSKVYNKYFIHFIKSEAFLNQINSQSKGGTQKFVTLKILRNIQIPLPPLPTQQKIASILDAADTLRQKDKALLAKYDELTQSLFLDMFGDPVSNNLNFPFPKIKDFTTVSQGMQIAIKERHKKNGVNRYKYLTVAYLNGRKEEEYIESPRLSVVCNKEEILMIRTGNTGQVVTNVEGVFHNNFFKIDWNRDKLNKIYLVYFLSNPVIRRNLLKRASTTTIPDLSHGQFYDLNIIVPLLSLQIQFAERVTIIEQQKALAQASLEKSEELFNSLLQKAFKGEL